MGRKMRMLGSSKDGENRPLRLVAGTAMDTLITATDGSEAPLDAPPAKSRKAAASKCRARAAGDGDPAPHGAAAGAPRARSLPDELMVELLDGLDEARATEYAQWLQVGIVLRNEGYECAKWDAWSQRKCPAKYEAGACEQKWDTFNQDPTATVGTLWKWLQTDDADLARQLLARKHGVEGDEDLSWLGAPDMWRPYQLMRTAFEASHFYHEREAAVGRMLTATERVATHADRPFALWPSHKAKEALGNRWTLAYTDEDGGVHTAAFVQLWLQDPRRRTVRGVVFEPDPTRVPDGYMNLYAGPVAAEYEEGDVAVGKAGVARFLELTATLMAHNKEHIEYVLNWAAHLFQRPGEKPGVALIFRSDAHGVGKDTWFEVLGALLGPALYVNTSNAERDLFGEFACAMDGKLLVKLEEVQGYATRKNLSQLKAHITSDSCVVNRKGEQSYTARSFVRFVGSSNEVVPLPVEHGQRRVATYDVSSITADGVDICQNGAWWGPTKALFAQRGVLRAIYDYLMGRDLASFNVREFPCSEYSNALEKTDVPAELQFITDADNNVPRGSWVKNADLFRAYAEYCKDRNLACTNIVHFSRRVRIHAGKQGLIQEKTLHGSSAWLLMEDEAAPTEAAATSAPAAAGAGAV